MTQQTASELVEKYSYSKALSMSVKEIQLKGGRSNSEVVRIGNTVHRKVSANSDYVHSVLKLLEEKHFEYSPRFLGIDEKGREVLSFIDGEIFHGDNKLTDEQLISAMKILKEFHDATNGSSLAGTKEVVCHNDFAPWNIVIRDKESVAVIDFDDVAPGMRIGEIAYFLWTFLDLGSDVPVEIQAHKIKLLCDVYGNVDTKKLISSIIDQQKKILEKRVSLSMNAESAEAREFSKYKIEEIKKEIAWVEKNRMVIEGIF